jgi:hypothetical protein
MATTETLNLEVKSNIKSVTKDTDKMADSLEDVNKEAKEGVGNFTLMGVSLNGVKNSFAKIIPTAKLMFGTIKAGLISTGIGAFLVAIGSLATFFTKTKKGAEILEVAFAGLGAAVSVIVDRVAKFGGAIVKLFQGDAKGALQDVKGAFTDIGAEIVKDTENAMALKKAFQELRDSQRKLNVETAEQRAEIERLKLIAEDVTKSEKERLKAAEDAFAIENKLLAERVANAEEAVRIQREQNEINNKLDEDLDALAQKEIDLANIKAESTTKQIELNNKINAIQAETAAKRLEELNTLKEADALRIGELTEMPRLATEVNDQLIQADENYTAIVMANAKKRTNYSKQLQNQTLAATASFAGALSSLAGENKQLAAAEALINTYLAVQQTMADKTIPSTTLKFIMAGTVLASGLANVKRIFSTNVGSGGGGSSSVPSASAAPPSPQMMSGAFQLEGGQEVEPARAYVVSDDITANQNALAVIRRRATI